MTVLIPNDWPEWPPEGLEYLGKCPVCGSANRILLHDNLIDRWFHAPGRWKMYQCDGCNSGYIDPRPNQATIGLAYTQYSTHQHPSITSSIDGRFTQKLRNGYLNTKYAYRMAPASRLGYFAMHFLPPPLRLEWDHFARHLPKPTPGRNKLLDVGCGNGDFLARARWQGWDVYGIDLDEVALSLAREAGIPVVQGAIEPAAFPPESFDCITSNQVIEHMHEPIEFLQTLHSWLKPDGRIWLGTPNINSALHQTFGADWCDLHPPQHLVIFNAKSLVDSISACGFSKVQLLPRGYLDSHFYRQSAAMQETTSVGDYTSLTESHQHAPSLLTRLRLETLNWLQPDQCSDIVAIAVKSKS